MALSRIAIRRLTKLADYMERLPKEANKHFYMGAWFEHGGDDEHNIGKFIEAHTLNYCGITACALGWAATIPAFRKAGLKVTTSPNFSEHNEQVAENFFDIDFVDKVDLFGAINVRTPKQWAKHCRKFLSDNA